MEKLTDFFKDIKERVSNPFISSFVISWIIVNWKIVYGLISYTTEDYAKLYKGTFIDFVENHIDINYNLWYPLLYALGYTLILPFLFSLFTAINSWAKSIGVKLGLEWTKGGKVPMNKYLILRDSYLERNKRLDQIIAAESITTETNTKLQDEISSLKIAKLESEKGLSLQILNEQEKTREMIKEREKELRANDVHFRDSAKLLEEERRSSNPRTITGEWEFFELPNRAPTRIIFENTNIWEIQKNEAKILIGEILMFRLNEPVLEIELLYIKKVKPNELQYIKGNYANERTSKIINLINGKLNFLSDVKLHLKNKKPVL